MYIGINYFLILLTMKKEIPNVGINLMMIYFRTRQFEEIIVRIKSIFTNTIVELISDANILWKRRSKRLIIDSSKFDHPNMANNLLDHHWLLSLVLIKVIINISKTKIIHSSPHYPLLIRNMSIYHFHSILLIKVDFFYCYE